MIAPTPEPPYVVVIFTSLRTSGDHGYDATAARMEEGAAEQPGYLGIESARGVDGLGITVSYWATAADATAWKHVAEHLDAQRRGRDQWYRAYAVRVCEVRRAYDGPEGRGDQG